MTGISDEIKVHSGKRKGEGKREKGKRRKGRKKKVEKKARFKKEKKANKFYLSNNPKIKIKIDQVF